MHILRLTIALCLVSFMSHGWANDITAWMKPQTFELSDRSRVVLEFERISDTHCDMPIDNFVLKYGDDPEPFLEAPALLSCGDTHFEGVHISTPVMRGGVLTIFSYWNYWGMDGGAPVGAMKTDFEQSDGKLVRGASQIYYEPGFQYGGRLLRQGAENTAETQQRNELIAHLERQFSADFVVGAKRDALFAEVQTVLGSVIQLHTKQWCQTDHTQNRVVAGADIGLTPCSPDHKG